MVVSDFKIATTAIGSETDCRLYVSRLRKLPLSDKVLEPKTDAPLTQWVRVRVIAATVVLKHERARAQSCQDLDWWRKHILCP